MSVHHLNPSELLTWPKLLRDAVAQPERFAEFHAGFADARTLARSVDSRSFDAGSRAVVVEAVRAQYASAQVPANAVLDKLALSDSKTITTGHQLSLAGGPLFFLVKIAAVIRNAKQLESDTGVPVIPCFWMATEDHDFEEISRIQVGTHSIKWAGDARGAVGRIPATEAAEVLKEGAVDMAAPLAESVTAVAGYYASGSLADATRRMVHDWFGDQGLLIVDGDDPALKRLFIPMLKREMTGCAQAAVSHKDAALEALGYKPQIHARDINLFYLEPGKRTRFTLNEGGVALSDSSQSWSWAEVNAEIEAHPERFSPNVAMRPVYQEVVLPNIAYCGGPGEMSYWLQLKGVFEEFQVPYPLLFPRPSVTLLPAALVRKQAKLKLEWASFFGSRHTLEAEIAGRMHAPSTDSVAGAIASAWQQFAVEATDFDPSLKGAVDAEGVRFSKAMTQLNGKILKAAKRKSEVELQQLNAIFEGLFPDGGGQERSMNWMTFQPGLALTIAALLVEVVPAYTSEMLLVELAPFMADRMPS